MRSVRILFFEGYVLSVAYYMLAYVKIVRCNYSKIV